MAEAEKGNSSLNPKKKNTLLDDDIGKEFLSSWKSMSVTDDDDMDFSFSTISKGKKKAFNFENLDADFNLDGDFGKLSSFKVDMSDFDFSSSPQKVAKPKERSEGKPASGNRQGKQDPFGFSFDFNELDNFNFEPCLMKEENNLNKKEDSKKKVSSDGIKCQGTQSNLVEGVGVVDDTITMELPAFKSVPASKVDSFSSGHANSVKDDCASKIVTSGSLISSESARSSPENKAVDENAEESSRQSHFCESALSTELCGHPSMLDFPGQSSVQIKSNRITVPEGETESCPLDKGTGLHTTSSQNMTMRDSSVPCVTTSGSNDVGKNQSENEISTGTADDAKPAEHDLDIEDNSCSGVSRKATHDCEDPNHSQNLTSKVPSVPLGSDPVVDKLTLLNENEPQGSCSNALKNSYGDKTLLHQSSSFQTNSLSSGIKGISPLEISHAAKNGEDINANDAQTRSKLHGNPMPVESELTKRKDGLLGSENNYKDFNTIKECFGSDGLSNGCKLAGSLESQLHDKEVTKSFQVSSSEKTNSSNQRSVNPKLLFSKPESTQNSNIISVVGSKLGHVKVGMMKSDFSTWKLSKTLGANKGLSDPKPLKKTNSLLSSEKIKNLQSDKELETNYPAQSTEKQLQLNLSLKRKADELPAADLASLKPLKRLPEVHGKSSFCRGPKPLQRVVEEKEKVEHPTPVLESSQKVNVMELEISSSLKNDENVRKAESYTKELENICNMLKKKHEEAKEIFLQAVVNNNNLLMLNHPIYEVKIRKVQKFAAELMSRELKT